MSGGEVSGNSAGMGGGVFFATSSGIFTMSGGTVAGNIPGEGRGKEVIVLGSSPLILSGDAKPERVLLYGSTSFIKIAGPLTGGSPPIALDLGITDSDPLANWVNKPILQLDASYNTGNLASLKDNFTLGNTQVTDKEPYTKTAISGYKIADDGKFVSE
jgi:hypothetical protein